MIERHGPGPWGGQAPAAALAGGTAEETGAAVAPLRRQPGVVELAWAFLVIGLSASAFPVPAALVLAAAFVAVRWYRLNVLAVFLAGWEAYLLLVGSARTA